MNAKPAEVMLPVSVAGAGVALTPMDMLDRAVTQGASVDVLQRLMDLQERWEKNQARKAFDEAMAEARAEFKPITKNRHVGFKSKKEGARDTDYWHEDLAEVARTVDPVLAKHGLSYRFRTTSEPNEPITVTCIVSHRLGHSEENTLRGGRDDSGNKNSLQAIGSAITYLQRYTLKAALGLAASNDDDGKTSEPPDVITAEQLAKLKKLIADAGRSVEKFCEFARIDSLADLPANRYEPAVMMLKNAIAKKDKPQ